ncbi:unnamed protein product [Prunus brigantina]
MDSKKRQRFVVPYFPTTKGKRKGKVSSTSQISPAGRGRGTRRARPKGLWSDHHVASGSHAPFNEVMPLSTTTNPLGYEAFNA